MLKSYSCFEFPAGAPNNPIKFEIFPLADRNQTQPKTQIYSFYLCSPQGMKMFKDYTTGLYCNPFLAFVHKVQEKWKSYKEVKVKMKVQVAVPLLRTSSHEFHTSF